MQFVVENWAWFYNSPEHEIDISFSQFSKLRRRRVFVNNMENDLRMTT